ncbi:HIT family protein [Nocardioides flavus (ex Wang et al. 2016)]|uniref:HIT family protein n=1 Tax=Nocardioides flavus (ex Wang et al. 2016) TaxID=2058780 RepID=A0ABQ3HLC8_9ACTN|nr:HIT domain-containing protein [Nocardioides flavus (ex Wang et al. 2016)]GHE16954.1 HIT family protein [Nocardioides flavus (ex Wang et al. 2016)]
MPTEPCPFCDLARVELIAEAGPCAAIWTNEPPAGSLMVIPKAHRETAWDLTPEEWSVTRDLLHEMMRRVGQSHQPDGWNIGWNVGEVGGQSVLHAHCHLVPRYRDERHAGKGLRWWFKQPDNASLQARGAATPARPLPPVP